VAGQSVRVAAQVSIENRDLLSPAAREIYHEHMGSIQLPDPGDNQSARPRSAPSQVKDAEEKPDGLRSGDQMPTKNK
jgi:hypothetical protein